MRTLSRKLLALGAAHAARMLPAAKRVALTASVVTSNPRGRGLAAADVAQIKVPVLWVHHRNDPCEYTPYRTARRHAEQTGTPLLTVAGVRYPKGKPCMVFSEHGFVGMEAKTIKAMLSWIRTGAVPGDLSD